METHKQKGQKGTTQEPSVTQNIHYILELGPQNHNRDGLLVPNSIMVVYMDPLG